MSSGLSPASAAPSVEAAGASSADGACAGPVASPSAGEKDRPPSAATAAEAPAAAGDRPHDKTKVVALKAPMVGVYFAAPAPGADQFVAVG
ncbi:hypothetical protein ACTQWE_09365, partial [Parafannyhessea sp. LCP19S3_B1]